MERANLKRVLSLLLAVVMVVGMVPVTALAAETEEGTVPAETVVVAASEEATAPGTEETVADVVYVTVTFDAQNGTENASQTVVSGSTVSEPEDPALEGYVFAGWYNGEEAWDFETAVVTADVTLTASWQEIAADPTETSEATEATEAAEATEVTEVVKVFVVKHFQQDADGDTYTEITADQEEFDTLEAAMAAAKAYEGFEAGVAEETEDGVWFTYDRKTYTVTFSAAAEAEYDVQTVRHGALAELPEEPAMQGASFAGWYVNGEEWDAETPVTGDLTVIANWEYRASFASYEMRTDDYYKVVADDKYDLAPGIVEHEYVLNNSEGTHRQVAHVVEVDMSNPYAKVLPSYKGMIPAAGNYGVQIMSEQAAWAEANGYGNVVAAMNLSLSWYNDSYYAAHPELIGEPLGYMVLNGEMYVNSKGMTSGAQTCVVINFDEKDGVARPADMPKVVIRSTSDAITGWEEQVIPANFGFLVKNGVNQYSQDHNSANGASRSFVGIKADGTFVMVMNDGRQSPYSAGFTSYEMAEFMLSLGCVQAVNGDGGGSSAFLSQRPGEELEINCSPSDGAERPTTHGILVISTAPADGAFARASISSENKYYTPGSTVTFSALGTDLVGTEAEIPAEAYWQVKEENMGTIENGVFTSNGTTGTVTAQLVYNDEVVGEGSIEIVIPEEFAFAQSVMTIPYDKEVDLTLIATINGGLNEVVLKESDVTFVFSNNALGTLNGFKFTSVSQENAPEDVTSTVTATLNHGEGLVATATMSLGKGSEVLFSFDSAEDIQTWNTADVNGNDEGYIHELSYATASNGQVHDGAGSLRVLSNTLSAVGVSAGGYAQLDLYMDEPMIVENAKSIGFWAYIPDEYEHCWIRVLYWYDPDGDGVFDKKNTVTVINQPEIYNTADENGWRYFSVDVSAYSKVLIPGLSNTENFGYNSSKNDANNFRFIEFMFPHTNTNDLWKTYGTINGPYTIYVDSITADYSDAVDDREAPIFGSVTISANDVETALLKNSIATVTTNSLTVTATVAENTAKSNATGLNAASAKAYIDGVPVNVTLSNGRMTIANAVVADGAHRVKFEISDNMGNKSVVIRLINVNSGVDASTVQLVPRDAALDRLYGGSVYWMDLKATDIETIQSISTVIDLNSVNHWELDHMELATGFTGSYTIDAENNTATITITRTGTNEQTGEAVLASLPIRIIYFDTDIQMNGYTAQTYWTSYDFWPQDLKVDVDKGQITYVDGYSASVLNAFSNEEFSVDTEMYTSAPNMDASFRAARGTAHVHTAAALEDKAAACTTTGYTGRTYCEVCESVVEWGTTTPATGHTYEVVDGALKCDCGEQYIATGLVEVNGTTYYMIGGGLQSGWVQIKDAWHYFDTTTYAPVETMNNGYVTFSFEADGKLVSGQWYHSSRGSRYYYGPEYYKARNVADLWVTIDGNEYCFNMSGYCMKGYSYVRIGYEDFPVWYDFGDDGICRGKWEYTGLAQQNGYTYVVVDGVTGYGLYCVDGAYYYAGAGNYYAVVTNIQRQVDRTNGVLPAGVYRFGYDGKMVDKNVYNVDNTLYYFEMGKVSQGTGVFTVDGVDYTIDETGKVFFTGTLTDASGQTLDYVDGVHTYVPKNGPEGDYFYINDVKQTRYKLVEYEGDFYFINDGDKLAKNVRLYLSEQFVEGHTFPDGTAVAAGYYEFDADGKMVVKNGPDGDYFYKYGIRQVRYQLVEFEGDFYFINDGDKLAKSIRLYLSEQFVEGHTFADGTAVAVGYYEFDADGKMVVKNGPDGDYFYKYGIRQSRYQLVEFEGDFYFINDGDKLAKSIRLYLSEQFVEGHTFADGTAVAVGYYEFDADGKMIVKNGPDGDYFYKYGIRQSRYQLVEFEGDFYFINDADKLAKNVRLYLSEQFVEGFTFADGTAIPAGIYEFDADGKMLVKNGPEGDYFYKNGIRQVRYQLVEFEGNFYFINDADKLAKSITLYLSDAFVEGHTFADGTPVPAGLYYFDADGKMAIN